MNFPYSDEYLYYDTVSHRYILTENYVMAKFGKVLASKYKGSLPLILDRVSALVYGYIHEHNDSVMQDFIIAKTQGGRDIIREAMSNQFTYMSIVGDFSTSSDDNKRTKYLDITAKNSLLKTIPEIGTTILYTGSLCYYSHDTTPW